MAIDSDLTKHNQNSRSMRFASEGHTLKSAGLRLMFSEVLARGAKS
jgi:hypothetical protein